MPLQVVVATVLSHPFPESTTFSQACLPSQISLQGLSTQINLELEQVPSPVQVKVPPPFFVQVISLHVSLLVQEIFHDAPNFIPAHALSP